MANPTREELRALHARATPGEAVWLWDGTLRFRAGSFDREPSKSDAAFIAAACNSLVPTLDALEACERERDNVRTSLSTACREIDAACTRLVGEPSAKCSLENAVSRVLAQRDASVAECERLRAALRELRDAYAARVDGMDHDDEDCPQDDTCECANVARVNALIARTDRALGGGDGDG